MRFLYPRDDFAGRGTVGTRSGADTPANQGCPVRQLLSLHGLSCDCRCHRGGSGTTARGGTEEVGQPVIPRQRRFDMIICRRITVALIALISMDVLFGPPAHAQTNIRFILDWSFQGQHAMFTMPVDDGTYTKLGLNVTVDRGGGSGDTVTKVASGAYDLGFADIYSMIRFNDQNPDHKLIAVMMVDDKSALAIEMKASSPIKTPQDLTGKTLASPVGDATRQLFPLFAAANKLDEKSIKWINVSPELREPLLVRGEADAITGHLTTVMLNLQNIGVKPEFAARNAKAIRNFIRGSVHGFNAMIKDPAAAVASIKKRDPLVSADVEKDRIKMSLDYRMITENVLKNGASNVEPARLEGSVRDVAEAFGIKKVPPASEVYTDQYLPP